MMEQNQQESLGQFLRKNRETKNISIEQVAYATRISLKMLYALEEDDHSALPAPTFVRGYLQAYAKSVHMDQQDLLLRYQHHLATVPGSKKTSLKSHYLYVKERYQEKKRMLLVTSLLFLLVLSGGSYLLLKSKRARNKQLSLQAQQLQSSVVTTTKNEAKGSEKKDLKPKLPDTASAVAEAKKKNAEVEDAADTDTDSEAVEQNPPVDTGIPKKYNLTLKADQDVWLRYQTDTDEIREIVVMTGKTLTLRANKVIKIFSGNLIALHASMNGGEISFLAGSNRSRSVVLPDSEVANYPLPLFPEQAPKDKHDGSKDDARAKPADLTSSDN